MKTKLLMGIDIGTQSSRAALLDLNGRVIAAAGNLFTIFKDVHDQMQTPFNQLAKMP